MPRNSLIAVAALLLAFSNLALAKPENCGKRVQAYNEYEELAAGKIVEKVSIFDISEWAPDSAFEGLAVSAAEDPATKVEIEMFKGKSKRAAAKKAWAPKAWSDRQDFRRVESFSRGKEFFGSKFEKGSFVVRLTLNGKVLCEDAPRKMAPAGD